MKRKWIALFLIAALLLTGASGCAGDAQGKADYKSQFTSAAQSRQPEQADGITSERITETEGTVLISADYPVITASSAFSETLKNYAEQTIAGFKAEKEESGEVCGLMLTYKPYQSADGNLLSIKFTSAASSENAQEDSLTVDTFVYDLAKGTEISLAELFDSGQDYLTQIAQLTQSYLQNNEVLKKNMDESLFSAGTAAEEQNYSDFAVTPEKIVFFFDCGAIAPASAGTFQVGIPLEKIAGLLNADYKDALCGGLQLESTQENGTSPASPAQTDIYQIRQRDGFMPAKSIEGIDPLNDKVVALTFDDGPHETLTPKLLDILKENEVVATFFVLGQNVERYPDIVKRAYEEGNEIGTHSYDHPQNWPDLSVGDKLDQYTKANDAIEAATGLRALIDRPPGGAITEAEAASIGREQIIWSMDPKDWVPDFRDPDTIYSNVMNGGEGGGAKEVEGYVTDGCVILSHDVHETTVDAYDRIIKELKSQGYKFVTITQMMQIAEARGQDMSSLKFYKAPEAGTGEDASE